MQPGLRKFAAGALAVLATLLLASTVTAAAEEHVESFHAEIVINADGSLDVAEALEVLALGQEIKRGIIRHLPLRYSDGSGNTFTVGFELQEVLRNGNTEPFKEVAAGDGVDIYIGSPDRFIDRGTHTYLIRYRTTYQLGHFEAHDELYWNVTGTEWPMPISRASATVTLPAVVPAEQLQLTAYTGPYGSQEQAAKWSQSGPTQLQYETTRALGPREGLTIVAGFPKGLVNEPPVPATGVVNSFDGGMTVAADPALLEAQRRARINRTEGVALIVLGLLVAFYTLLWGRVGRDPQPGRIYLEKDPPEELSPAALRYITTRGNTSMALGLALMNMARKGALSIAEDAKGEYTLNALAGDTGSLAPEEKEVYKALFSGKNSLEVKQANHARLGKAQQQVASSLNAQFGKGYFNNNQGASCLGCLGGLIALGVCAIIYGSLDFGFASVTLFFCGLAMIGVVLLFSQLMPAYTKRGRELLDRIEGFKLYLTGGDPQMPFVRTFEQAQLFGDRLPYAQALGVESTWTRMFSGELAAAQQRAAPAPAETAYPGSSGGGYIDDLSWRGYMRPRWYNYYGSAPFDPGRFSQRFHTHFPSRLNQASVDPTASSSSGGSSGYRGGGSSGFSGGGSSGGGRGGGGGRGW